MFVQDMVVFLLDPTYRDHRMSLSMEKVGTEREMDGKSTNVAKRSIQALWVRDRQACLSTAEQPQEWEILSSVVPQPQQVQQMSIAGGEQWEQQTQ
jgi:hypothetical protein